MKQSPYAGLPPDRFWRTGVAEQPGPVPENLYVRKWDLSREMPIATAGSCFAQHIGRTLKSFGFNIIDSEPAPPDLPSEHHLTFGYSMYSARYGNIYTIRQMLQLAKEAFQLIPMSDEVWETHTGFVDALRPTIDPEGYGSKNAVALQRERHLERVRQVLQDMDVFVFTFGLTEAWENTKTGMVYPVCPGTIGGEFDSEIHAFRNFTYPEIIADFLELRELLLARKNGKELRFILTVSPVPLTATAAGRHVQVSTVYSKSVLRAVTGALSDMYDDIDYFPSYEIITSPWSDRMLYKPNKRTVAAGGVKLAMETFSKAHGISTTSETTSVDAPSPGVTRAPASVNEEDADMLVKCDEELLGAFGKGVQ